MEIGKFLGIAALAAATAMPLVTATEAARAAPAAKSPVDSKQLKLGADALIDAAYPADGPGASVIVTRGGRTIYAAGRGMADVDARRPIAPVSVFRLGSITKQFTAAVILQLVAEGKMSLDDPVSRFLPDFPQPGARATVRQVLNHMSGIQDYTKIPRWMADNVGKPQTTADLVAAITSRPSLAEPGAKWEYNNGGYVLLGAIVEKVTGKPWHQNVAERIARPLGLKSIAYGLTGEGSPSMVRGYTEQDGRQQLALGTHMSVPGAAGGLIGSAEDLAKWAQALHRGRVVSPALYREMTSPGRLVDGSPEPYGFGLRLKALRGRPVYEHGGAIRGFSTASVYFPSEDLFVAVFANSDDPVASPSTLMRRIAALALGEPFPALGRVEMDAAALESLSGTYGAESGPPRRVFTRDGKLFIARGDEEMELVPAGGDVFHPGPDDLAWLKFERRQDGAHVLEVHRPDKAVADVERAVRTGPAEAELVLDPALLRTYAGTCATETSPVVVALGEDGKLSIAMNSPALPMRPVSQTEFMADKARSRVIFHVENGQAVRLTIRRGAREIVGRRVPLRP